MRLISNGIAMCTLRCNQRIQFHTRWDSSWVLCSSLRSIRTKKWPIWRSKLWKKFFADTPFSLHSTLPSFSFPLQGRPSSERATAEMECLSCRLALPEDISMKTLLADPQSKKIFQQMKNFMQSLDFDIHPHQGMSVFRFLTRTRAMRSGEETDLSVEALEDAAVKGSVMLMSTSFHAWSGLFRVPEKTTRMIYAFMGSRKTTSSDTQAFLTYLVWKFLSRFVPPPYMKLGNHVRATRARSSSVVPLTVGTEVPVVDELRKELCVVGKEGVLANWKFSLLANVYLIIMLPIDRSKCAVILDHFFEISVCSLPLLRRLGLRGICATLRPITLQTTCTDSPLAAQV